MKKASIVMFALFAAAALAGAIFIGGSRGVGAQTTTSSTATTAVSCSPVTVTAAPGQSVMLSASGGDGVNYVWSSPGLTITNPTGSSFNVEFNQTGSYLVTVTSAGTSATCDVAVTGSSSSGGSSPSGSTPGLPNTGELFGS